MLPIAPWTEIKCYCDIDYERAVTLAELLKINTTVTKVSLWGIVFQKKNERKKVNFEMMSF